MCAIRFAHDEARRFSHTFIGPEHLLLGLLREENARKDQGGPLMRHGFILDRTRAAVRKATQQERSSTPAAPDR